MNRALKTRRLATLSIVCGCIPAAAATLAICYYFQQPPPLSGFAGVGWFLGMMGLLALLLIVTYALAPISILTGLWALRRSRDDSPPRAGRRRAIAGIVISALALATVAVGHVEWSRRSAHAHAADQPRRQAMAERRAPEERVTRLIEACRAFAYAHEDRYPSDLHQLRTWCGQNGRWTDELKSDEFAYLGAGAEDMTRRQVSANDMERVNRLILFVQNVPSSDGLRVLGFSRSSAFVSSAKTVSDSELASYLHASDDERRRRGYVPVRFHGAPSLRGPASQSSPAR